MTATVGPDSIFRRCNDVRYRAIDREAVAVRQRAAEVLVVNEVAARVLDLADGRTPLSGWVAALAGEFEVEPDRLERDLLGFAAELMDAGLLELAPEGDLP